MNRIKECRVNAGMSQKYVALSLGIKEPSVSTWESGKTLPSHENIIKLSKLFNVSADYLLGLSDGPIRSGMAGPPPSSGDVLRVPVLGTIRAGIPISAVEEILDWEELPASAARHGEYLGLRVKGDSMINAGIFDGDLIFARQQKSAERGEIIVS